MNVVRKLLLALSTNIWLRERAAKTPFVARSVSRFMPGERLEDALAAAARQQAHGIGSILTHLGENVTTVDAAETATRHCLNAIDRVESAHLGAQISVKPTQLGLDLGAELCYRNLQRLIDRASERRTFIWLDMENARYVDATLDLFRRTRERSDLIGVALQAYLYRTERDVESLLTEQAAIRLVKGAYLESADAAYARKADVDENFFKLACRILSDSRWSSAGLLHIATHDSRLIGRLNTFIADRHVPSSAYEYAMLYGIQEALQQQLAKSGRRLRVLISYGEYWFPWYMRRLAERPANVLFLVRSLLTPSGGDR